jgi:hypothetical protein
VAGAQPTSKPVKVGFLWTATRTDVSSYRDAFGAGLRQLGYLEGRDVTIEHRYADDRVEAPAGLADAVNR